MINYIKLDKKGENIKYKVFMMVNTKKNSKQRQQKKLNLTGTAKGRNKLPNKSTV